MRTAENVVLSVICLIALFPFVVIAWSIITQEVGRLIPPADDEDATL